MTTDTETPPPIRAAIPDGEVDELCTELGEASKRVVVPSGRGFCDTNSATWRAAELITRQAARLTALEAELAALKAEVARLSKNQWNGKT